MSEVEELRAEVARLRAKVKQLRDGGDGLSYVFVMTYGRSGSTLLMGSPRPIAVSHTLSRVIAMA